MRRLSRTAQIIAALMALGAVPAASPVNQTVVEQPGFPKHLSDFRFFGGAGVANPQQDLIGYTLRTPLFSDYAEKRRMIYLPAGARLTVASDGAVQFPVGTAIIKSFGYYDGPGDGFRPLETRVLLHRANGWVALPYVWRDDLSDADLALAGARIPVTVTKPSGARVEISYAVPNKNQCKECHSEGGAVMPIGPNVHNMEIETSHGAAQWQRAGVDPAAASRWAIWDDPKSGFLDNRARAYLHANCAHCHRPSGSASNSGLYLRYDDPQKVSLGLYKRPVAAGRGSGNREFAITPGHPDASIMLYRMASNDPGIAMPEVGRALVHDEGVALIRDWITSLPGNQSSDR